MKKKLAIIKSFPVLPAAVESKKWPSAGNNLLETSGLDSPAKGGSSCDQCDHVAVKVLDIPESELADGTICTISQQFGHW